MIRKLTLIFVLAILFGAFLIVNPYLKKVETPPNLEDRLPDADFMATVDCIRLAREINGMMYYYKVPYRDFLSPEFILAQAKAYGLNLQNSTYFFANKNGEFGVLAQISDSSKLSGGMEKLKFFFDVKEKTIFKQKIYSIQKYKVHLFYGSEFIFFYRGENIEDYIKRIKNAKANQVSPSWMELINQKKYLNKSVVLYSLLEDFNQINIHQAMAYPEVDSTHVTFHTCLSSKDSLPFTLKNDGMEFKMGEFTKIAINLHIDPSYLKNHPEHPLYMYLQKMSGKIRFPFKKFMENWAGDLCFQQGGWINVDEKIIESEIDDDFNVTEVEKIKQIKVPGFSLQYSSIKPSMDLINTMSSIGFLTIQNDKYHLLFSPPLNFKHGKDNTYSFYASKVFPKMQASTDSYVIWSHKGTQYTATIDSVTTNEFYGNLTFSLENILNKSTK